MVKNCKSPCQLLHSLQTTSMAGFFLPKPTAHGALTQSPPALPVLLKCSHQLHHTLLNICLSLHGTGWEQVLGVQELQGQVLGAAAPSSAPSLL